MKKDMRRGVVAVSWLVSCAAVALCRPAYAVTVNFDALTQGVQLGNVLAASGVILTTGNVPDTVMVGDTITLANPVSGFEVFAQSGNAVSPPNFATASGVGLNDVLISFISPVTFVSLRTDHFAPEAPDVVRLLALAPTGTPNQFQVLAIAQGSDDAGSAPADTLSVDLGGAPFGFALFQTTTEPEGFDDLMFTLAPLPAPSLSAWGMIVLSGLLVWWGMRALRVVRMSW
jgi:hypothetical protein